MLRVPPPLTGNRSSTYILTFGSVLATWVEFGISATRQNIAKMRITHGRIRLKICSMRQSQMALLPTAIFMSMSGIFQP